MNSIDSFILEPSLQHFHLSQLLLVASFVLYLPYLAALLGGTLISVVANVIGRLRHNRSSFELAWEVIDRVTVNTGVGLLWGFLPLITITLIFSQLLYSAATDAVLFMFIGAAILFLGLALITIYRHTFRVDALFDSVRQLKRQIGAENEAVVENEFERFHATNYKTGLYSGIIGVLALIKGAFIFLSGVELVLHPEMWATITSVFHLPLLGSAWAMLGLFLAISILFAALFVLLSQLKFGENSHLSSKYLSYSRPILLEVAFSAGLTVPAFIVIYLYTYSSAALSTDLVWLWGTAVLLLLALYHYIYHMVRYSDRTFVGGISLVLALFWIVVISGNAMAIQNALRENSGATTRMIAEKEAALAEAEHGSAVAVDGEEVFKRVCTSCHAFDHAIVGPAYNNVLPKYKDNLEALKAFVNNPTKKDPKFTQMPKLGLKPAEIDAVARYLLNQI